MTPSVSKEAQTRKSAAKQKKEANEEGGVKPAKVRTPRISVAMIKLGDILTTEQLDKIDEVLAEVSEETGVAADLRILTHQDTRKKGLAKKLAENGTAGLAYDLYATIGRVALRNVSVPRVKLVSL